MQSTHPGEASFKKRRKSIRGILIVLLFNLFPLPAIKGYLKNFKLLGVPDNKRKGGLSQKSGEDDNAR